MKHESMLVAGAAGARASPAYAQFGGIDGRQGAEGSGGQAEVRRPQRHRGGRAEDRRGRQRQDPRSASASCRIAAVHKYVTLVGTTLAQQSERPEPAVDLHRARHRRRQRVRVAGRHRAHHARRARPDQERSGAGRRARRTRSATSRTSTPSTPSRRTRPCSSAPTRRCRIAGRSSTSSRTRPTRWCSRTSSIAATRWTPTRCRSTLAREGRLRAGHARPTFLTRLDERNKDQPEQNGLFASHPETKERIDTIRKLAGAEAGRHRRSALQGERSSTSRRRSRRSPPSTEGSAGLTGSTTAKKDDKAQEGRGAEEERLRPRRGLEQAWRPRSRRRRCRRRAAREESVPIARRRAAAIRTRVKVTVTPAEIATFKKGIA